MSMSAEETTRLALPAGGYLEGRVVQPAEARGRVVLYVHGFGSVRGGEKALALEAACARRGWAFAAFDFRGHGTSSGAFVDLRGGTLLADLEAVREALARRGLHTLWPVGSSMGGWAAAWFALRHPEAVPACVLIAPTFDFPLGLWDRLNETQREDWRRTGRLRLRNDWLDVEVGYGLIEQAGQQSLNTLSAGWRTPLLAFHGMADDVVPFARTVVVVGQMRYPRVEVRLFKDGDHRLTARKDEIAEAACEFFARHPAG